MKRWEELICENVFGLGGHRDHLSASLAHMLYCIVAKEQYNLAYFFFKQIECARATPTEELIRENVFGLGGHQDHLPACLSHMTTPNANLLYGMFLTCLFRYVMEHYPDLDKSIYNVVDRVMRPPVLKQTQKPQSDHGMSKARHSVSSSFAHHFGSSSHHGDDDEDD
nr:hypothetical protein [Tanacetum cinerariifolium]